MASNASQVRVGITGTLYRAPKLTAGPATTAAAWAAAWVELGYLTVDGPELIPTVVNKDIDAWQTSFPVRTVNTAHGMEWKFTLLQRNGTNLKLAMGGGTITALGAGDYRYDPPAPGYVDEMALGLEVVDGSIIDRYILDRAMVTTLAAIPFKKDDAVKFTINVKALEANAGQPWRLISNDPALAS